MIIDARHLTHNEGSKWGVWDCENSCYLHRIVWVNDETNQYGQYEGLSDVKIVKRQARKITILVNSKRIWFNPATDEDPKTIIHIDELDTV